MATAFETAARDLFNDENLSRAAIYTPPNGADIACRVMVSAAHSDALSGPMPVMSPKGRALKVLAGVVTPEKGGFFTIGSETHKVQADPVLTGPNRLAWRCLTREVEAL